MSMENIPIYLEARKHASLPAKGSNSGLVFEKFFPRKDENHTESFKSWLCNFMKDYSPDPSLLSEYVERQKRLVRRLNGKLFLLGNDNGCFVTGMGRNHPLENGFLWHPILGTPYLPGSSLKGAVRSWMLNDQWNTEMMLQRKLRRNCFQSLAVGRLVWAASCFWICFLSNLLSLRGR